ncbi:MAG TPA: tape measure protein [Gemmataceae bacterium]|jgi:tape measure domain-containing protein|nr:tape measure protein [Gemmataceae bacterium]
MAGTSIGSTALHLSTDSTDFVKGLEFAEKKFESYAKQMKADSAALRSHVKKSFDFGDLLKIGAPLAVGAGGLFAGLSLTGLIADSVKLAASVETIAADFGVLTGNMEVGAKLFADINKFADETPLKTDALADAARILVGAGVAADNVVGKLRQMGDLAGISGDKLKTVAEIYGEVRTNGALTVETLKRLGENGVNIIDPLAKVLGVSRAEIRGLAEDGKIGIGSLSKAFDIATSEGGLYFNRLITQSKTFDGMLSTLEDSWKKLKATVGKAIIEEFNLKGVMAGMSEFLSDTTDGVGKIRPLLHEIKEGAVAFGNAMFNGLVNSVAAAGKLVNTIDQLGKSIEAIGKKGDSSLSWADQFATGTEKYGSLGGWTGTRDMKWNPLNYLGPGGGSRLTKWLGFDASVFRSINDVGNAKPGDAINVEAIVNELKAAKEKFDNAVKNFGNDAYHSMIPIVGTLGKEFGKAAGESAGKEFDGLTQKMLDQLKGLKDQFDPMHKVARDLKDLDQIKALGGFNLPGLGGMIGRMAGGGIDPLFKFAQGGIFKQLLDGLDFTTKRTGIAEKGSSEAASAVIEQKNAGQFKAQDKILAALNVANVKRDQQIKLAGELIQIIKNLKIMPAF